MTLTLTWQQIETVLVAAFGEDGRKAADYLRHREGLLNQLNNCGDVNKLSGPIDGGLVAIDRGAVAECD